MDIFDAIGVKVNDLVGSIGDAGLLHGCGRGAELIHKAFEALGHERAGELDGAGHLLCVGDGHDTGDHGHGDAGFPDLIEKIVEQVIVKEHLGGEERAACVYLFLQMTNVLGLIAAFGVDLGIACAADAEIRAAFLQLPDEIHSMAVDPAAAVTVLKLRCQVTPQSHHIFDASGFHIGDALVHRFPGGGNAGQMRQCGNALCFLDVFGNVQRILAGAASGTVSYTHERGMELGNLLRGGLDAFESGVCLGREDLKRKRQFIGSKQFC